MKALIYKGPHEVAVEEREIPRIKGNALIKVSYSGVCGSDLTIVSGKHPRAKAPLVLGHEFVGTVVEVEDNPDGIKVGDRVTMYPLFSCGKCLACRAGNKHVCNTLQLIGIDCDGCMAEYASVPTSKLIKVPDDIDDETASLLEPLAVIVHGIHMSGFKMMDEVMVTGGGPIGILTGIVLKEIGAAHVYITEIDKFRLSVCKELGMDIIDVETCDPVSFIREKTNGEGVDLLIEASGAPFAAEQMTDLVRVRGRILVLATHKKPTSVDLMKVNFKEISLVGSRVYTKEDYRQAVNYASRIKGSLKKIITHRLPLAEGHKAFDMINDKSQNTLKVLIQSN